MPEQKPERDQIFECLPPAGQEWVKFEERVLKRSSACLPVVRLIELALGRLPADESRELRKNHVDSCQFCAAWVRGFERPLDDARAASLRRYDEVAAGTPVANKPAAAAAAPVTDFDLSLADLLESINPNSISSRLLHVTNPGALLDEIQPALSGLLADVGLSPHLAGQFRDFALGQPGDVKSWLPQVLTRFAREKLGLPSLPCLLDRDDWATVFTNCTLRIEESKTSDNGFFVRINEQGAANPAYRLIRDVGRKERQPVWPTLEEQQRLAQEVGIDVSEYRLRLNEACKYKKTLVARCLAPEGQR